MVDKELGDKPQMELVKSEEPISTSAIRTPTAMQAITMESMPPEGAMPTTNRT